MRRISERFIANDPPLPEELSAAQSLIDLHLDDVLMDIPSIQSTTNIYGVAGTISATSMIEQGLSDYNFDSVHGHIMSKQDIEEVFRLLATDNREGRLSNPGMEEGRRCDSRRPLYLGADHESLNLNKFKSLNQTFLTG